MKRARSAKFTAAAEPLDVAALFKQHRRELRAFCYRMTGGLHDAEDCTQETFSRAHAAAKRFDGRAPRAWLYRIATNVCLDLLRKRGRRELPTDRDGPAHASAPLGPPLLETPWLEPAPDPWLAAESRESISIAFVALLQRLSPRARAVLVARDVLDFSIEETATLLGISTAAVNGMLYRARAALRDADVAEGEIDREVLARFVAAWRAGDASAIVAALDAQGVASMPPLAAWYRGRASIAAALRTKLLHDGSRFELVPIHANGSAAFAMYRRIGRERPRYFAVMVMRGGRRSHIAEFTMFLDAGLRAAFALPRAR